MTGQKRSNRLAGLRTLIAKRIRRRLEKAGWMVGGVRDFLELSDEEAALVEAKLKLVGEKVRAKRTVKKPGKTQSF